MNKNEPLPPEIQAKIDNAPYVPRGREIDLDDSEMLERLESKGVAMVLDSYDAVFKVKENGSTGFGWLWDDKACTEDVVSLDTHVQMESNVNKEQLSSEDGAIETVQVRTHMVGMPSERIFTLTPENVGECTFRLAYARPWEFSFENEATSKPPIRRIEIPI